MNDECFDFLRNQKQLGYTVYAQLHKTDDVFGVSITIYSQRDKFTVEKIKETVDEFLQIFTQILKNTTDTAFEGKFLTLWVSSLSYASYSKKAKITGLWKISGLLRILRQSKILGLSTI